MSHRLAVLLRAVNVGGTGKLAMADFKVALHHLGYAEPSTLGAAGSAVIATPAKPAAVEAAVGGALKTLGVTTDVFVRTHDELGEIIAGNPFDEMARDKPSAVIVSFLTGDPTSAVIAAVRAQIVGPEQIAAGPGCLYIAYGQGMGRTRLTGRRFDRAIGLRGTGRNWNTVRKLHDLTAPHDELRLAAARFPSHPSG